MKFIYNISVHLYYCAVWIASFFNKKANLWIAGRKNIFDVLGSSIGKEDTIYWFHCASLGEFEQGRPLIEKYKVLSTKYKVLLTFFSPSGYEVRKNYTGADYVFYLPLDTPENAKRFMEIARPKAAFFIKYEFWYNYLGELKKQNIPTYLVSGIFRREQIFFQWYGTWFRDQLRSFTHFFLQNENSKKLIESIGYKNSTISGDTRFDRVWSVSEKSNPIPLVEKFKTGKHLLVAGSTWNEDEKLIGNWQLAIGNFKLIVAPHEVNERHIQDLIGLFSNKNIIRYSKAEEKTISDFDVLVIDNIGMLSSLYKYADIAYIGGGFGKGIHNILEAAVFGCPVVFGPNFEKFEEAKDLVELKGAFVINSTGELEQLICKIFNHHRKSESGLVCKNYVSSKRGATEKIMNTVK